MVHLIQIENSNKVKKVAEKLYKDLQKQGIEVLYDERQDKTAGEKLVEADLIGIPYRVVVSEKTLAKNSVEIKERGKSQVKIVKLRSAINFLKYR